MKIDLSTLNTKTSANSKKYGISRRTSSRITSNDHKKGKENIDDSIQNKVRMPGKICKNLTIRYPIEDSISLLRL